MCVIAQHSVDKKNTSFFIPNVVLMCVITQHFVDKKHVFLYSQGWFDVCYYTTIHRLTQKYLQYYILLTRRLSMPSYL